MPPRSATLVSGAVSRYEPEIMFLPVEGTLTGEYLADAFIRAYPERPDGSEAGLPTRNWYLST
jgi:hypothetical protein